MNTLDIIKLFNSGKTEKEVRKILRDIDLKKAKEPGKSFGVCDSCENETVLVDDVGLCGPCCFGEADTANGNW